MQGWKIKSLHYNNIIIKNTRLLRYIVYEKEMPDGKVGQVEIVL